jgi:hypothetical protein
MIKWGLLAIALLLSADHAVADAKLEVYGEWQASGQITMFEGETENCSVDLRVTRAENELFYSTHVKCESFSDVHDYRFVVDGDNLLNPDDLTDVWGLIRPHILAITYTIENARVLCENVIQIKNGQAHFEFMMNIFDGKPKQARLKVILQ